MVTIEAGHWIHENEPKRFLESGSRIPPQDLEYCLAHRVARANPAIATQSTKADSLTARNCSSRVSGWRKRNVAPMTESSDLMKRPWATATAVLGFAMLAVYLTLILSEGGVEIFEILPWALLMATGAVISFAGAIVREPRLARNLLIGAALLYGVIGAVAILSIGFGFLIAAATAVIAIARLPSEAA